MFDKVKKSLLYVAVCAALFLGAACMLLTFSLTANRYTAQASGLSQTGFTVNDTTYGTMEEAWAAAKTAGTATVTMYSDAEISQTLVVGEDEDITLDLNGKMLKFTGESGSVIQVGTITWYEQLADKRPARFTLADSSTVTRNYKYNIKKVNAANGSGVQKETWEFANDGENEFTAGGVITGGKGTTPSGSSWSCGGGVYVQYGSFAMTGGTIAGNTAHNGGGVYGFNITLSGNAKICGNSAEYNGGGAYIGYGNVNGNSVEISDNMAVSTGGGVYVMGGAFTMNGGTIKNNISQDNGGGVWVDSFSSFVINGGTITENKARVWGGGVCLAGYTNGGGVEQSELPLKPLKVSGNPKIFNNVITRDGEEQNNVARTNNCVIAVTGALTEGAEIHITSEEEQLEDCIAEIIMGYTFNAEKPSAFFILDDDACLQLNAGTVTVGEHSFDEGVCTVCGKTKAAGVGSENDGYTYYDTFYEAWTAATAATCKTIKMLSDAESAKRHIVDDSKTVTLDLNGHVLICTHSMYTGNVIEVRGTLTLIDSNPNAKNTVTSAVDGVGEIPVKGGVITSTGSRGGVAVSEGGSFTMEGGTIAGNRTIYGGGVGVMGYACFIINGGTITGNTATGNGGGVAVMNDARFIMNGGTITGNAANGHGGGIDSESTELITVSGAVNITGNTVGGNADNVYFAGDDEQKKFNIAGALKDDKGNSAKIGVKGSFTTIDYGTNNKDSGGNVIDPNAYFFSDDGNCLGLEDNQVVVLSTTHEYNDSFTVDTAATCTTAGSRSKHCKHCGGKIEVTAIPATGHDWGEWTVTKQPTATEFGEKQRVCTHDSSHVETEQIAKLTPEDPSYPNVPTDPDKKPTNPTWIVLVVLASVIVAGEVGFLVYRYVRRTKKKNKD